MTRGGRPTPAELRAAAIAANDAAVTLARAAGAVANAGLIVDDEVTRCTALITSWAAWVAARAAAAEPTDDQGGR